MHKIITNLFLFNAHIELNISFLCVYYGFYCAKFDICTFIVIYQRSGRYSQERQLSVGAASFTHFGSNPLYGLLIISSLNCALTQNGYRSVKQKLFLPDRSFSEPLMRQTFFLCHQKYQIQYGRFRSSLPSALLFLP